MDRSSVSVRKRLLHSLLGGVLFGAVISALSNGASFFIGWLAATLLLWVSFFSLITAWNWGGAGKQLAWMIVVAFFLRLSCGAGLSLVLPGHGYDTDQQNAGYLFYDAYQRDLQAWELSQSDTPLWMSFQEEFTTDQYGGLLSLSAAIYRFLSPDVHRQLLILILSAFMFALGVPFFWKAICIRWNERLANTATWILILYPDSILFGSSQMREPFLISLICIAFWAILSWSSSKRAAGNALVLSVIGMSLISSRVALVVLAILIILFWLENLAPRSRQWQVFGWIGIGIAALAMVVLSWGWFKSSSSWDMLVTELSSGWVQKAIGEVGGQWRIPFVVGYGLAQPVLPAAIADPTLPLWKVIGILRAIGWYALAPLILYSCFTVWKIKPAKERNILLWLVGFVLTWLLISSLRAGGDQWDNPRYRTLFLPWMALLAAWSLQWAIQQRDFWLARWFIVEVIFLAFFTNWYFSRYFHLWKRLPFWQNVVWIVSLSALVLGSGFMWDLGRWLYSRITSLRT